MRKVFLDCGGHDGCSAEMFLATFPDAADFEVHIFEANPRMCEYIADARRELLSNERVTLHNVAVSDRAAVTPFYVSPPVGKQWGSSLCRTKKTGNLQVDAPISVQSVDLSQWMQDNFAPDDYIVLKLNVEGAEYQILPAMMMDGTLAWIDRLFVNWHGDKIGLPRPIHDVVLAETNRVVKFERWNAEEFSTI